MPGTFLLLAAALAMFAFAQVSHIYHSTPSVEELAYYQSNPEIRAYCLDNPFSDRARCAAWGYR